MTENWLPIEGAPELEVSDHGRVRVTATKQLRKLTAPKRKPFYLLASVKRKNHLVHRLVAAAFCPGEGPVVRHLDGNYLNNHASNLAWGTAAENVADTMRHGKHAAANKTHCKRGHPFSPENTEVSKYGRRCRRCTYERNKRYKAEKRAAKEADTIRAPVLPVATIRAALRSGDER